MITVPIMVMVAVAPPAIMTAVASPVHPRGMIAVRRIAPEMAAIVTAILAARAVPVIVPAVIAPIAIAHRAVIIIVIKIVVVIIAIADTGPAIIAGAAA
jgi:hypothetical protein